MFSQGCVAEIPISMISRAVSLIPIAGIATICHLDARTETENNKRNKTAKNDKRKHIARKRIYTNESQLKRSCVRVYCFGLTL